MWSARFRPIVQDFILGQSHPDCMIASSDTYDKMLENMLDWLVIGLNSPIAAEEDVKGLADGYLQPNKVIRVKRGQKLPERINLGGMSQGSIEMLKIIQARMESNAASAEHSNQ